jgi:hypothetical protein
MRFGLIVGAAVAAGALSSPVGAAVVVSWNFNDSDLVADVGTGTITPALQAGGETVVWVPGTTANAQPGVPAGNALGLRDLQPSGGIYQVIGTLTFSFSTVGYRDIVASRTTFATANSFWSSSQVTYSFSTDGVNFTAVSQGPNGNGDWIVPGETPLGPGFNNNPNAAMRLNFSPFGTLDGLLAFDNITFTGNPIPEPTALALLAAPALLLGRRRRDAA